MVKNGFKSSEFYVALVGIVGIMWQFISTKCSVNSTDLLTLAGIVVTYILGRSWVKSSQNTSTTFTTTTV
jgi:hypothetical protein